MCRHTYESLHQSDPGRKIPFRTGESNLPPQCACQMLNQLSYMPTPVYLLFVPVCAGVPGVKADRLAEAMEPQHCALSLVGEPIMYPEINAFVSLLHEKGISSFLVTNAQFPDAIK